ncbi:MAG: isochorismate synthase [Massilibacteroides sp.]|nr:isochorismate synthase [Massilibacteroides sp.]
MTSTGEYAVLDNLIKQNRSFAIYRLPGETSSCFVMQRTKMPQVFQTVEELNGASGFVVAPFRVTPKSPVVLICPDCTSLADVSLDKSGNTPEVTMTEEEAVQNTEKTTYALLFKDFKRTLLTGELDKIVLSRNRNIIRDTSFSAGQTYFNATQKYPHSYVYLFHTPQSGTWLGSTPEILLSGQGFQWKTVALAGTQFPNSGTMIWDKKNREEQEIVSSYLKEQLSAFRIVPQIDGPYTVKAGELAHLRTDFNFQFPKIAQLGTLLHLLHPTPAVSGFPKEAAYQFILEHEKCDRLYYTGFLGMLEPLKKTDIYVNLRCMHIQKSSLTLFAGGGLLASSSLEEEWEETEQKLKTMLKILS